jgi:hypothetical protein
MRRPPCFLREDRAEGQPEDEVMCWDGNLLVKWGKRDRHAESGGLLVADVIGRKNAMARGRKAPEGGFGKEGWANPAWEEKGSARG